MLSRRLSCISLLLLSALLAQSAAAQAGQLDPAFGSGGIVTTDFGIQTGSQNAATANAAVIQSDGKIVVVGAAPGSNDFPIGAVLRYNPNGSLDTTFGTGGIVTTAGIEDQPFTSVALQSDGKIVAVAGGFSASVARFTTAGVLDSTFGTNGIVTLAEINGPPQSGVLIQPDGKILVANHNLFRLLSTGQLDTSFGANGAAFTAGFSATGLALLSNGEIVVTSSASGSGFITQYQSNGALDTTFGVAGQLATPATAPGLVPLASGELLSGGSQTNSSLRGPNGSVAVGFALSRYLATGITDASFGTNGGVVTLVPGYFEVATSGIALEPNGEIVIVGTANQSSTVAFALARFTATGQLDNAFGHNGTVVTSFANGFTMPSVSANGLTIQSDGKIVVVGSYSLFVPHRGVDEAIKVLRYLGS